MSHKLLKSLIVVSTSLLALHSAMAAPTLKANVMVSTAIVTVGDMFDGAGLRAEEAMFRAPAPGTAGVVPLDAIRAAALKAGLTEFDAEGIDRVRVARQGTAIDETMLTTLIAADLKTRGILTPGMTAQAAFDASLPLLTADDPTNPARLVTMRYMPASNAFAARFAVSGIDKPLDVSGQINLLIEAPHLAANLAAGTILSQADVEMKLVPLKFAEGSGFTAVDQLIGKTLQRPSRAGMMLKATDVADPDVVARNQAVTVYFRNGPMTLTVKGQALNSASLGQPVSVLNSLSKKVLTGVASANGVVEIKGGPVNVAGL